MSDAIETTGADIESAVQAALAQLGLGREQVKVDVLEEPKRGLLGLGNKLARVRVTPIPQPSTPTPKPSVAPIEAVTETAVQTNAETITEAPEFALSEAAKEAIKISTPVRRPLEKRAAIKEAPTDETDAPTEATSSADLDHEATVGVEVLGTLLRHMGIEATVRARRAETDGREEQHWILEVNGSELGDLIGYKGEALSALQYLTRLIASNQLSRRANLVIDVEGYKSRREEMLKRLARKMAAQAVERGRTVSMEPMPPHERRIIHLALQDNPSVTTESIGEGERRKVTIIPKRDKSY
jgi:spoIIIJ-associated protein